MTCKMAGGSTSVQQLQPKYAKELCEDHLDSGFCLVLDKNIFRFQIAVDDVLPFEETERLDQLEGKLLNQLQVDALEVCEAHVLVQIV